MIAAATRMRRIGAGAAAIVLAAAGAVLATSAAEAGGTEGEGSLSSIQTNQHQQGARTLRYRGIERVGLRGVDGRWLGRVVLRQSGGVVVVKARVRSLAPGFHGFHIHTTGLCEAGAPLGPFTTAGGHFTGGATTTHGDHAGDMPSLLVTEDGWAFTQFATDRFTLDDLHDDDGSAVMIHQTRDNFANIPTRYLVGGVAGPDAVTLATGDAGARVACGVID